MVPNRAQNCFFAKALLVQQQSKLYAVSAKQWSPTSSHDRLRMIPSFIQILHPNKLPDVPFNSKGQLHRSCMRHIQHRLTRPFAIPEEDQEFPTAVLPCHYPRLACSVTVRPSSHRDRRCGLSKSDKGKSTSA